MSRIRRPAGMQGFSLIEVLVAVVVLSIGLLGVAALQISGLRVGQSSFYRAQAAQFATDMADRLRANLSVARAYGLALDDATPVCSAGDPPDVRTRNCDLAEWRNRLRSLPGGNGAVAIQENVNAVDVVTITVRWDDTRGGGGTASDLVLVTNLPLPPL